MKMRDHVTEGDLTRARDQLLKGCGEEIVDSTTPEKLPEQQAKPTDKLSWEKVWNQKSFFS